MNEILTKGKEEVECIDVSDKIYEVRGKLVMIDFDLGELYKCKNGTKTINQAVNRNLDRFPIDFYFQLTEDDILTRQSQVGTTFEKSKIKYRSKKNLPYVFTEAGVAMLATIIRTPVAAQVSINIMRAFVAMRRYISNNLIEQKYINNLVIEDHNRINLLENTFNKLEEKTKVNQIFFEGQIYDAYSLLMEILSKAQEEIIIIDNFAGRELLNILKEINKKIIIVSKNINEILVKKYSKQYKNVSFINNDSFHDRFIIIDRTILYHSGASMKDLGKKCFAINLIEDKYFLDEILNNIKECI